MLGRPGDLIPVLPEAAEISWTRRRSQILNYLHRGPVNFSTMVYDTNVGDISSLACYFNKERISVDELNNRFGHYPGEDDVVKEPMMIGKEVITMPRLLLYPLRGPAWGIPGGSNFELEENFLPLPPAWPVVEGGLPEELDHVAVVQRTVEWVLSQKQKKSKKHEKAKSRKQERRPSPSSSEPHSDPSLEAVVSEFDQSLPPYLGWA